MLPLSKYLPNDQKNNSVEAFIHNAYPLPDAESGIMRIELASLPLAHVVTLPNRDLLARPQSSEAHEAPLLKAVYTRLQKPVPHFDSSTGDYVTGQASNFVVLGSVEHHDQQESQRNLVPISSENPTLHQISKTASKLEIEATELYPITSPIEIENKIDQKLWDLNAPLDHMQIWSRVFKGYEPMPTRGKWPSLVNHEYEKEWKLELFGLHHNSLKPIAALVSVASLSDKSIEKVDKLLYHAITMICWQFYSMERDRWLQIKLDPLEPFYEVDVPSFFMFFLRYDIKKDAYQIPPSEWQIALESNYQLGNLARKYDFVSFFTAVMEHLRPILNQRYFKHNPIRQDKIKAFAGGKLFNNFLQLLHTSHFWTPFIEDFDKHVIDSVCSATSNTSSFRGNQWMVKTLSKHYVSMTNNAWIKYDLGAKPQLNNTITGPDQTTNGVSKAQAFQVRVPIPHCHVHFSADEAVFVFPEMKKLSTEASSVQEIKEQSRMQDVVLNQISKCIDLKTIKECRTVLNRLYHVWRSIVVVGGSKRSHRNNPAADEAMVLVDQEPVLAEQVEWEDEPESKAIATKTTRKRKAATSNSQEPVLPLTRPTFADEVSVNLIRARYSYYIDREAKSVCVGVVPYLKWTDDWAIEPETSVSFIHPRVWEWLVDSGKETAEFTLNKSFKLEVTTLEPNQHFTVSDNEQGVVVLSRVLVKSRNKQRTLKVIRVLKNQVALHRYTMDFDCVRSWFETTDYSSVENWYVLFYGLIVLVRSEKKAAALITAAYQKQFPEQSALPQLQRDYKRLREKIKNSMYQDLKKEPSLDALISIAKETWDRKSHCLISPESWRRTFSDAFVKQWVRGRLHHRTSWRAQRQQEDVTGPDVVAASMILVDEICKHLADPESTGIKVTTEVGSLYISVPQEGGYTDYLSPQQLCLYVIGLFEPLMVKLSYLFQHMFPPAVILDPCNQQHQNLTAARNVSPHALGLVYSMSKGIRNEDFVQEVHTLLAKKQEAAARGEVFEVPALASMLYNTVLYHMQNMDEYLGKSKIYQTNLQNCSEKDKGIEQLKDDLRLLCTDTIFSVNQNHVIKRCVNIMSNTLDYNGKHIEEALRMCLNELLCYYNATMIPGVMFQIMDSVAAMKPLLRARVNKYKTEVLAGVPAKLAIMQNLKDDLKQLCQAEYVKNEQQNQRYLGSGNNNSSSSTEVVLMER